MANVQGPSQYLKGFLMWCRYFEQWLPLVNEFIDSPDSAHSLNCYLLPPLDCACIWHCHKLNPVRILFLDVKMIIK